MPRTITLGFVLAALLLSPTLPKADDKSRTDQATDQKESVVTINGIRTERRSEGVLKIDMTGKGAVLCMLGILEIIKKAGSECYKGKDADFQLEVGRSIERIDRFVVQNSPTPVTPEQIAADRAARDRLFVSPDLCGKTTTAI